MLYCLVICLPTYLSHLGCVNTCTACALDGAVYVGVVQSTVTHVEYWLRPVPSTEPVRRLADHGQHVVRCHLLCTVRRSYDGTYPVFWHVQTTLPWKGLRCRSLWNSLKWTN